MSRGIAVVLSVMIGASMMGAGAALADARQDCAKLSGDDAIRACTQAIRKDSRDVQSYCNRGVEYQAKGDFDRAFADYTRAIEIDPKYADAYNNRGNVYVAKGDFDRAIADYTRAIGIDPKYAKAYNGRCWLRATANRDLPLALSDCDTAIRLAPKDASSIDSRGFVYLRLDRLDEAIADYDAALKIDPKKAESLYGRGLARTGKGDTAGGDSDVAAARAIKAGVADEFAKYGVK